MMRQGEPQVDDVRRDWHVGNPGTDPAAQAGEPRGVAEFTAAVHRRQLTTPLLLLLASHRPLTFLAGQLLYALAPICALAGWDDANAWAALLSAPDANQRLTAQLATPQPPQTVPIKQPQIKQPQTIKHNVLESLRRRRCRGLASRN